MDTQPIENKIAKSGLISLDLEDFYLEGQRIGIDMKDYLFQEAILREKDFRETIKTTIGQSIRMLTYISTPV